MKRKKHIGNGHPKLTKKQVLEIRSRFKKGEQRKVLALDYNVHNTTITHILNNKTWKHLTN